MSLRDIKTQARGDLHREAAIPALYIAETGADPVPVSIRLHTAMVVTGNDGNGNTLAGHRDIAPRIVFLRSEVATPLRNAVVSIAVGEAYQVQDSQPADGITVTAMVVPLSAQRATGLPVPL